MGSEKSERRENLKMREDTLDLTLYNAPADDLMSEEDSLHLRVLDMIAPLVLHHLLGRGVDESDVDVLFLTHACTEIEMNLVCQSL